MDTGGIEAGPRPLTKGFLFCREMKKQLSGQFKAVHEKEMMQRVLSVIRFMKQADEPAIFNVFVKLTVKCLKLVGGVHLLEA